MIKKKYNEQEGVFIDIIAKNFKLIRLSMGQSRDEVAKFFNCSPQQIAKYESGLDRMSAAKLFMYSEKYKVSISNFISKDRFVDLSNRASTNLYDSIDGLEKSHDPKYYQAVNDFIKSLQNIDRSSINK